MFLSIFPKGISLMTKFLPGMGWIFLIQLLRLLPKSDKTYVSLLISGPLNSALNPAYFIVDLKSTPPITQ